MSVFVLGIALEFVLGIRIVPEGSGRAARYRFAWGCLEEVAVHATLARVDDLLRMFTGLLR